LRGRPYEAHRKERFHRGERWLQFFLTGVIETAEQAAETAQHIVALFEMDAQKIATLGKASSSALGLLCLMQKGPVMSLAVAAKQRKRRGWRIWKN
jgi:hypothetical protein